MSIKIKPCSTVGSAYMVVQESKFGKTKTLAIGLTKFEAECCKSRLTPPRKPKSDVRIVCAAIRKDELIVCGARHFDPIMRMQLKKMNLDGKSWEQGFIDQYGKFLTREEAWEVAKATGQIRRRCGGDNGRLFSENLY